MRREILYLTDIVEASSQVASFIAGIDFEQFQQSELIRSAVVQKLTIIGEAAGRLSPAVRGRAPEVPWPQIVAFRNILVHAYFGIDWNEVWISAKDRCPSCASRSRESWQWRLNDLTKDSASCRIAFAHLPRFVLHVSRVSDCRESVPAETTCDV